MDVVVVGNRIHDNAGGGVFVQADSSGLFERNEIASNKSSGFMISAGGNPTLRGNRVHGSPLGIVVGSTARGTYIGNDVRGNTGIGLAIHRRSAPVQCEGNVSDPAPQGGKGKGGPGRRKSGRRG
jgi:parallel beta-helix repeat protein